MIITMFRLLILCSSFHVVILTIPECVIELGCPECLPDHMPLVTSHKANEGAVRVPNADEVTLSCGAGRFLLNPLRAALTTVCEDGRYRITHDGSLRHLVELGCQEDVFEDVLHTVEYCGAPLQGRAYQYIDASQTARHLATLCYDEDRGLAGLVHVTSLLEHYLPLPPHSHNRAPLTLLGNFNEMFDTRMRHRAEALYSDEARLNRRLREMFKHDGVNFSGQTLTAAKLISELYFDDQNVRVTEFVSNKVAAWTSVASGNLRHMHEDVAHLMARVPALHVYAGTHGEGAIRTTGGRSPLRLGADRFPVPRYLWTVVADDHQKRALAVVVLNDPFVAVSEVRDAVFCESMCGRVSWLRSLRRHRHYEAPLYGLTFCCHVHNFTALVNEMPRAFLKDIPVGDAGMLTDLSI